MIRTRFCGMLCYACSKERQTTTFKYVRAYTTSTRLAEGCESNGVGLGALDWIERTNPKGPCTQIVYTLALKYSLYMGTLGPKYILIWVHGPLGKRRQVLPRRFSGRTDNVCTGRNDWNRALGYSILHSCRL